MFLLSERCTRLREEAVNKKEYMKYYYAKRNVYFNMGKAMAERSGRTPTEAIAAGLSNTLNKFTPVIIPGELIVGFNFGEGELSEYYVPDGSETSRAVMAETEYPLRILILYCLLLFLLTISPLAVHV